MKSGLSRRIAKRAASASPLSEKSALGGPWQRLGRRLVQPHQRMPVCQLTRGQYPLSRLLNTEKSGDNCQSARKAGYLTEVRIPRRMAEQNRLLALYARSRALGRTKTFPVVANEQGGPPVPGPFGTRLAERPPSRTGSPLGSPG